jgi:hypothetical protein
MAFSTPSSRVRRHGWWPSVREARRVEKTLNIGIPNRGGGQGRVATAPMWHLKTETGSSGGGNAYLLSGNGRDDWIRTSDPLTPSQWTHLFHPISPDATNPEYTL